MHSGHPGEVTTQGAIGSLPAPIAALTRAFHEPAILVRAADRVMIDANPAFERLLGRSRDDLIGRSSRILHVNDTSHREFAEKLAEGVRGDRSFSLDWPLRRASGEVFVARVSVAPIHEPPGTLFGFVGSVVDLTQTRHAAARAQLLSEASRIFAQRSLEPRAMLQSLAKIAVADLADYCSIDLFEGETLRPAEVAHADLLREPLLRAYKARFAPSPAYARFLRELPPGKTHLSNHLTLEALRNFLGDDAHVEAIRELGLRHSLTVPLRGRTGVIGGLSFARTREEGFGAGDEQLALELGERAASAYENAVLHERVGAQARILDTLQRVQLELGQNLDLERIVQSATDAGTTLTGAAFGAFFYNVNDDKGARYTLYTISGVPREAFAKFPMPRNTAVFAPTFGGSGVVRSDDITKDPRYGKAAPHHGMPAGHLQVRSYLAVPVRSREGTVHGGLFFGHPEAGRFTAEGEELARGIAAQAAIALDNAHLYRAATSAERRLRAIFDHAPVQILTVDREGWIQSINRSVVGNPLEKVVGKSVFDTVPEDAKGRLEPLIRAALRDGVPADYEVRVDAGGTPTWRQVRIAPIQGSEGIEGAVILSTDVTDRRNAEAAVRESEERFRTLVTATTNMVWNTDPTGMVIDMPEWREFTGQTVEEVSGAGWVDAIHPEDRERVAARWKEAFAQRAPYEAEYRVRGKHNEYRTFLARAIPRRDAKGDLIEYIGTWTDVTAQRSALQEAEMLRAQLVQGEKLAALGSLVSGVAHEIRTPLTYLGNSIFLIESATKKLAAEVAPERGSAFIDRIAPRIADAHESIVRIDRIVEDLRRYTKLKPTSDLAPMSLHVAVRDAVELYRATHRGQAVVLDQLMTTRPVVVDRVQMQQIVLNLLQNAGEAHSREGVIRVRTFDSPDGKATLEVSDDGQGIPPAVLDRIWDPFFTTKPEGSGLGLSIVKRIVEAHGARIACDTRPGEGTTFRVEFPRRG